MHQLLDDEIEFLEEWSVSTNSCLLIATMMFNGEEFRAMKYCAEPTNLLQREVDKSMLRRELRQLIMQSNVELSTAEHQNIVYASIYGRRQREAESSRKNRANWKKEGF